jgi:hypothetical protein
MAVETSSCRTTTAITSTASPTPRRTPARRTASSGSAGSSGASATRLNYLLAPLPMSETSPSASRVAVVRDVRIRRRLIRGAGAMRGHIAAGDVILRRRSRSLAGVRAVCLVTLAAVDAIDPGSLNTEPGDVAELPGELMAPPPPHSTPWVSIGVRRRGAYDGHGDHATRAKQCSSPSYRFQPRDNAPL